MDQIASQTRIRIVLQERPGLLCSSHPNQRHRCVTLPLVELVQCFGVHVGVFSPCYGRRLSAQFLLKKRSGLLRSSLDTWIKCGELLLSGVHEHFRQLIWLITQIYGKRTRRQGSLGFPSLLVMEDGDQWITYLLRHWVEGIDPLGDHIGVLGNEPIRHVDTDLLPERILRIVERQGACCLECFTLVFLCRLL